MGKRVVAVVVGAVVAVALVAGGVVLAARNGQRTPAMLPALDLSGPAAPAAQGAAPSGSGVADSGTESRIAAPGTVRYEVRGTLPALPRGAKAWALPDAVTRARVAELGRALGMAGEPTRSGQTWTVVDGTRRLFVNRLPGGPWTMADGRAVCAGAVGGIAGGGGSGPRSIGCPAGAGSVAIAPNAGTGSSGSAPSATGTKPPRTFPPAPRLPLTDRATAERIARQLFASTFAPMDGADVRLVRGFDRWSVRAVPRLGGLPTEGFVWTAGIGAEGRIVSATGWLDSPRPGDTYPLLSVQEALRRLRDRQIGGPILESSPAMPCARTGQPSRSPADCGPQRPLVFQVTDVRLGLRLATALRKPGNGAQSTSYLLPAYLFQLDASWDRQVSVIAVQDRFLGTTPKPTAVPLRPGG